MTSKEVIFWDVDTQADFMLPGGKLYVPGAENLIPNLERLVDAAREGKVFLVSTIDAHTPDDPEFRQWPPHCIQGTPGQKKIPQTMTDKFLIIPNDPGFALPRDVRRYKQIILEKQTLNDFDNVHAEKILEQLGREPEYCVFGVVTEYCVRLAALGLLARGYRTAIVTDAIETLDRETGKRTIEEFAARGARFITTEEALGQVAAARRSISGVAR
jgi:nicotinamidase/pyrazinamidase